MQLHHATCDPLFATPDFPLQQVIETAYDRACGEAGPDEVAPRALLRTAPFIDSGDGLRDFLLRETAPDGAEPESEDHYQQSLRRLAQVEREVRAVIDLLEAAYLHRFSPR